MREDSRQIQHVELKPNQDMLDSASMISLFTTHTQYVLLSQSPDSLRFPKMHLMLILLGVFWFHQYWSVLTGLC